LVGIRDDIRPEVVDAVAEAQGAGVQVVMITGDRKETAHAIACDIGLMEDGDDALVITSEDLAAMDDEALAEALPRLRVIARALPGDKSRLVRVAQEQNLVVGMTGDGVNDSPALKAADVGFAMGSGTEVAKEAAGISILDDDFASIEQAILYGRTIFNSIRKFIIFQLTINISAVLISFIFPLIGFQGTPLTITQILWINLIMDTLAALAFGGEPALRRFMQEQPKRRDESIITGRMWSSILVGAAWTLLLSLFFLLTPFVRNFFASQQSGDLMTGFFCLFVFLAVFNAFNARTERLNLFDHIGSNRGFLEIIALIVVVQVLLAYLGGAVFGCYGLSLAEWGFVLVLAFTIIPVDLIRKLIVGQRKAA
ncbi:MAG: HAD-IC family P-type ATPase, partial [Coriobacteriaceae bacterium]|nr:HAD-IC family P-type ATPase [Coriobacteriaceae bacterium]